MEQTEKKPERSMFIRFNVKDVLPKNEGSYFCTLADKDGKLITRKLHFLDGKFVLKGDLKSKRVINWMQRYVIEESKYQDFVEK